MLPHHIHAGVPLLSRPLLRAAALALALLAVLGMTSLPSDAAPAPRTFYAPVDPLARYVGQTTCDPVAKPGALALRDFVKASYAGVRDGGIVRACHLGGTSEHKEGRAWDWMLYASNPGENATAQDFLGWLLATDAQGHRWANARRLGVMYVIWDRRIWKSYQADAGWQPYYGPNPHTDHIHISLSWDGAWKRTSFFGPGTAPVPTAPAPAPAPTSSPKPAPVYDGPPPPVRSVDDSCPRGEVPTAGFRDTSGNVHSGAIDCAVWWKIAGGTSPTTYAPTSGVTRAQMASFLARTVRESGGRLPAEPRDAFRDDETSGGHELAINQLAAVGIVSGTGEQTYSPTRTVSRAQMATFLNKAWRYRTGRNLKDGPDYFTDDNGDVHQAAIEKIARAGFAGGVAPGRFAPGGPTDRAQMATFLARFLDLLVESGRTESLVASATTPASSASPSPVPSVAPVPSASPPAAPAPSASPSAEPSASPAG